LLKPNTPKICSSEFSFQLETLVHRLTERRLAEAKLGMAVGKVPSGHTKPYPYLLEKN
jgi:hypothetical protein